MRKKLYHFKYSFFNVFELRRCISFACVTRKTIQRDKGKKPLNQTLIPLCLLVEQVQGTCSFLILIHILLSRLICFVDVIQLYETIKQLLWNNFFPSQYFILLLVVIWRVCIITYSKCFFSVGSGRRFVRQIAFHYSVTLYKFSRTHTYTAMSALRLVFGNPYACRW